MDPFSPAPKPHAIENHRRMMEPGVIDFPPPMTEPTLMGFDLAASDHSVMPEANPPLRSRLIDKLISLLERMR